jgi:hypothetical protein
MSVALASQLSRFLVKQKTGPSIQTQIRRTLTTQTTDLPKQIEASKLDTLRAGSITTEESTPKPAKRVNIVNAFRSLIQSQPARVYALSASLLTTTSYLSGDPLKVFVGASIAFGVTKALQNITIPANRALNSSVKPNIWKALKERMSNIRNPELPIPEWNKAKHEFLMSDSERTNAKKKQTLFGAGRAGVYGMQGPAVDYAVVELGLSAHAAGAATGIGIAGIEQLALVTKDAEVAYAALGPVISITTRILYYTLDQENSDLAQILVDHHKEFNALYSLSKDPSSTVTLNEFLGSEDVIKRLNTIIIRDGLRKSDLESNVAEFVKALCVEPDLSKGIIEKAVQDLRETLVSKRGLDPEVVERKINDYKSALSTLPVLEENWESSKHKIIEKTRGLQYSFARDSVMFFAAYLLLNDTTPIAEKNIAYLSMVSMTTVLNNALIGCRQKGDAFDPIKHFITNSRPYTDKLPIRLLVTALPLLVIFNLRTEAFKHLPALRKLVDESKTHLQSALSGNNPKGMESVIDSFNKKLPDVIKDSADSVAQNPEVLDYGRQLLDVLQQLGGF